MMKKFWNGLREHKQLVFMVMTDWSLGTWGMTNVEVRGGVATIPAFFIRILRGNSNLYKVMRDIKVVQSETML